MENKGYAKFLGANKLHYGRFASGKSFLPGLFIAISRKVSEKCACDNPKRYWDVVEPTFVAFL